MNRLLLATVILILGGADGVQDLAGAVNTCGTPFATVPGGSAASTQIAFSKSEQTLGNTRTMSIAIEDVDLDGDNDIFIANYIGPSVLWLNDGNGVFSPSAQSFGTSIVHGVAIGDLNGDSYPDIFLLSHAGPSKVYFNNGSGAFTPGAQDIGSGTEDPGWVVLGDVDNDDDIDAFISYNLLPTRLWLNDGEGLFAVTSTEYGGDNSWSMALVDVNGDSFPDLFLCLDDQADEVWMNDGSGNFANSGQQLGAESGYEGSVACGDIDGDGDIDFAVSNSVAGVVIWLNQDNTGSFVQAGPSFEAGVLRVALFDADLDGDLDLISTQGPASAAYGNKLWVNSGSASFTSLGQLFGTARAFSIATGKLDQDEDFDVVLGMLENSGGNPIYFNESYTYVCGDANGDGSVNISDAVYLIAYIFAGGSAPNPFLSGDANCDSAVNISDAVYLIAYIFAGGAAPCAECP